MKYLLLLGAGFSHNWGGWLASEVSDYLLGIQAIRQDRRLRDLLWAAQTRGDGFEGALSDLQSTADQQPSNDNLGALRSLEHAIDQMLSDMNRGFLGRENFEFSNQLEHSVGIFLARFDAIFTLNQDLLLDRHYLSNDGYFLAHPRRWDGPSLPGMTSQPAVEHAGPIRWSGPMWRPITPTMIGVPARSQPYYKLHGSSNWRTEDGDRLLVAGGNKLRTIQSVEILRMYFEEFERRLSEPETRMMTVG